MDWKRVTHNDSCGIKGSFLDLNDISVQDPLVFAPKQQVKGHMSSFKVVLAFPVCPSQNFLALLAGPGPLLSHAISCFLHLRFLGLPMFRWQCFIRRIESPLSSFLFRKDAAAGSVKLAERSREVVELACDLWCRCFPFLKTSGIYSL